MDWVMLGSMLDFADAPEGMFRSMRLCDEEIFRLYAI